MKNFVANLVTAALVACAFLVTGLVVRREFFPPTPQRAEPRELSEWPELASVGFRHGPGDAKVTILEFSDFQCPFCARMRPALREVLRRYPGEVATVFRHYPLESIHPHAFAAAVAVECAGEQGAWETMHDQLFANQTLIGQRPFREFADSAGVADLASFERCLDEDRQRIRVRSDLSAAQAHGLASTPSIIVNGTLLPGTPAASELEDRIRRELGLPPLLAPAAGTRDSVDSP